MNAIKLIDDLKCYLSLAAVRPALYERRVLARVFLVFVVEEFFILLASSATAAPASFAIDYCVILLIP